MKPIKPIKLTRNRDFSISRKGIHGIRWRDLYHHLLSIRPLFFIGIMAVMFLATNSTFATYYWFCGPNAFDGMSGQFPFWLECFFFSVQTFATIGYGKISPLSLSAHWGVTLEAFTQLILLAIATGLFFARFSKPKAMLSFSKSAIIGALDGELCLFFRIANERLNQIVDAELSLIMLINQTTQEGQLFRESIPLKLEHSKIPFFALSWTVCHTIDEGSPLYRKTRQDLEAIGTVFIVSVKGTDETLSQMIHARYSYSLENIEWNRLFVDMIENNESGEMLIHLNRIDLTREGAVTTAPR